MGGAIPPHLNTLKAQITFQVQTSMDIIFLERAKEEKYELGDLQLIVTAHNSGLLPTS